jgi:hypothetical protein
MSRSMTVLTLLIQFAELLDHTVEPKALARAYFKRHPEDLARRAGTRATGRC